MSKKKNFIVVSMRPLKLNRIKETRDTVDQKLVSWINKIGYVPLLLPNTGKLSMYINKIKISGFVIGGGGKIDKSSLRYKREKEILKYSIFKKIPTLGICYGMQLMSSFEGGRLNKIKKHVKINHKIINIYKDNSIYPNKVNSYHNYTIEKLPKNFNILCTCEKGSIEAIKHKKFRWMGWMWHPERDKVFDPKLLKISKKFFKGLL